MHIKKELNYKQFKYIVNCLFKKQTQINNIHCNIFNNKWALLSMYQYVDESFSVLDNLQMPYELRVKLVFDYFDFQFINLIEDPDGQIKGGSRTTVATLRTKEYFYILYRNTKNLPTENIQYA